MNGAVSGILENTHTMLLSSQIFPRMQRVFERTGCATWRLEILISLGMPMRLDQVPKSILF